MKDGRYQIFCTPWHIGHQWDLFNALADHADFHLLVNNNRKWNKWVRPLPKNASHVTEYRPELYDLAILHTDQQSADPEIGKSRHFRDLMAVTEGHPRIVINHGSPMWPENKYGWSEEEIIERLKLVIGDTPMVVNSRTAVERWGNWGRPIIHGMATDEWWELPKEPRVVTVLSEAGFAQYYNRRLLQKIKETLHVEHSINLVHINVDWTAQSAFTGPKTNDYDNMWDTYRDFLGRSLLYINQTFDSPMPRSRTEAMLSGCCVLTSPYHDADSFIENGKNGFLMPDNPHAYVELIVELLKHPEIARNVGQEGKKTAQELFSRDRYRDDWLALIKEVVCA